MNLKQLLWLNALGGSHTPKERTITGNPVSFKTGYAEPMKLVIPFTSEDGISGLQISVNGKNFCPLPPEETKSGVTLTHNADGSITVTGTNGGSANYFDCVSDFDSTLFAGYLINAGYEGTNATVRMRMMYADGTSILNIGGTDRVIPNSGKNCRVSVRVAANYAIPEGGITLYPMIRKADTGSDFEAYTGTVTPVAFPSISHVGTLTVNADGTGVLDADGSTYSLSPGQVESIVGLNNVWTDTNGENQVTYIK